MRVTIFLIFLWSGFASSKEHDCIYDIYIEQIVHSYSPKAIFTINQNVMKVYEYNGRGRLKNLVCKIRLSENNIDEICNYLVVFDKLDENYIEGALGGFSQAIDITYNDNSKKIQVYNVEIEALSPLVNYLNSLLSDGRVSIICKGW
jgi:hypothetical protein